MDQWNFDPETGVQLRTLEPDPHCTAMHSGFRALHYTFCPSCGAALTKVKKR